MVFKIFDEVTSDCLEIDDVVQIEDAATSQVVYLLIDEIEDETDVIVIQGHDIEDKETEYTLSLDPDEAINLYMEVDED